jgi:aldehyde:ferredoxin oxidoreductase
MTGPERKLLRINLSSGKINTEAIDDGVIMDFIGGRGLGVYYLYREVPPGTDPLGEHNKLFLLNGPLAGTNVQSASRWMAVTRSPLTGAFARSVAGADFGAWLRWSGYDCIAIEDKAEKPVYIHLTADGCRINDAREIWGKDTVAAQSWLHQQHGSTTRVACIGPAGENLVKYAAIVTGRRTCGRCGTGTVMGSKNLKAIAINAQRNTPLHDPDAFKQLVKEQIEIYRGNKGFQHHLDVGTTTTHDTTNPLGIYPVRNFIYGQQENYEKLSGEEYRKLRTGEFNCYSCMANCGKAHLVIEGPYKGAASEGPEYESIWAFSGPIDSNNLEATIAADQLCDDLGLDTISTGNTLGFAYELYDTDGLELTWGNHGAMIAFIKKIASREGLGNILAEGSKKAASIIGKGSEAYSIQVKGLELPAYEPRGAKAHGFNYATANIGASHCYGYAAQEIFGTTVPRAVDRFSETDKADIVIYNQNNSAINETGIGCQFTTRWGWFPGIFGKMLAAATGISQFADMDYLWNVGERIFTLERAFNVRNGFRREHDTLPQRILTEPLHTRKAPGEGQMVKDQDKFLDSYYQLRGWSKEGIPTAKKLGDIGLGFVQKDMP